MNVIRLKYAWEALLRMNPVFAAASVRAMANPDSVAFTLFGYSVYWYGLLMAVGILTAFTLAQLEVKRKRLPPDTALDLCIIAVPLGVIGARLYYVLFNWSQYKNNPISILYVWEGGLAIYGAVLLGIAGVLVYAWRKRLRFLALADIVAPGLVLAQAIGRWGNFFNQEAYGPLVTNAAHKWFPLAVYIDALEEAHYATFFYESFWCFLVFLFLWFFLRKRAKHDGDVFLWYVLLYGVERALVEGLRTDSLYLTESIRVSQLLSFLAVLAVAAFFLARAAREKKLGRLIWPAPRAEAAQEEACGNTEAQCAEPAREAEAPAPDAAAEPCEKSDDAEETEDA